MTSRFAVVNSQHTWPSITWLDSVKTKSMDLWITPAMADHARVNWHYERQRNISKQRVNVIRRGLETTDQWGIHKEWEAQIGICMLPDGRCFLTNGNHTLEALRIANCNAAWTVVVYRFCRTMEEVHRVYVRTDAGKKRTSADKILAAHGDCSPFQSKQMSSTQYIARSIGENFPENMMPEEQDKLYRHFLDAGGNLKNAIEGGQNYQMIIQQAQLAIALITFKHQPDRAAEFWRSISFDDGLRIGQPAKTLLNYYNNNSKKNMGGRRAKLLARAVVQAWNAFYDGRNIEHLTPRTEASITIIKGCEIPDWLSINGLHA